jgi:hypothetical protein
MTTTITLNIEKNAAEQAEMYANNHSVSLSKLVENYLLSLSRTETKGKPLVHPLVESLTGVIPSEGVDNYKQEYQSYLEKKYL